MVTVKLDSKTSMITNVKFGNKAEKMINRGIRMRWETPIAAIIFVIGLALAVSIQ